MYSPAGIIVGAVVSALFGLYVFVPDGGLRPSNYLLGVWQSLVWNASAVSHSKLAEQKEEFQFALPPSYKEEDEVMDENQFQFIGHEDIMKRLQALSDLHGPEIGPRLPPRDPLSRMLRLHQAVVESLLILWPEFIIWLLPYLLDILLAQKICFLRKLQRLYQAGGKYNNDDRVKEVTRSLKDDRRGAEKMKLDNATQKRADLAQSPRPSSSGPSLSPPNSQPLTSASSPSLSSSTAMVEGRSELPDSKGLPAKRRRPGKRNSKRDHKFEAEKRKRKQAEKKAALAGVFS